MQIELDDRLKLAMFAGAFAIRNNKKLQTGLFTSGTLNESITWYDAEKILECTARELNPDIHEIIKKWNGDV